MAKDKKKDKADKKAESKEKKEAKSKKGKSKKVEEKARPVETEKEEDPQTVESALEEQTPTEKAKEETEEEAEELGKEEAKPSEEVAEAPAEEEEEELEIVEEKFYNLNLRKIWSSPREKRTPRAVRFLRDYVGRHMKTDEVAISEEANQMLWQRGISKPPRKIRVRAVKDKDGRVIVFPGEGK